MLNVLESAARTAGQQLLTHFNTNLEGQEKNGHQSLVSTADYESQELIKNYLRTNLPNVGIPENEIGFLGEEGLDEQGEYLYIVDPLDGTSNFLHGVAFFAISIACSRNGEIIAAVTYDPVADTLYFAEKGKGAFKKLGEQTTELKMKSQPLKANQLNTYYSSNPAVRRQLFAVTEALFPQVLGMRIWGSGTLELAKCAENLANIVIYGKCGVWDVAAAKLIIEEAGGVLADWQGHALEIDANDHDKTYQVLACHPDHVSTIVNTISQALTG